MKNRRKARSQYRHAIESLESRLLLSADLTVAIGTLPTDIPTGYVLNVPVTVTNNEPTTISGTMTLTVAFNDGVHGLMILASKSITGSLVSGGHVTVQILSKIPVNSIISVNATVPDTLQVTAVAGALTSNTPTASPNITWDFGNIPGLGNVMLTANDPANGITGVFTLTGPGMGSLSDPRGFWDMNLAGTTRATKIKMTPMKDTTGLLNLEQITAATMVGTITAPQTDFTAKTGDEDSSFLTFSGGLLGLTMYDSSALTASRASNAVGKGDLATERLALKFNNANDLDMNVANAHLLLRLRPVTCPTSITWRFIPRLTSGAWSSPATLLA